MTQPTYGKTCLRERFWWADNEGVVVSCFVKQNKVTCLWKVCFSFHAFKSTSNRIHIHDIQIQINSYLTFNPSANSIKLVYKSMENRLFEVFPCPEQFESFSVLKWIQFSFHYQQHPLASKPSTWSGPISLLSSLSITKFIRGITSRKWKHSSRIPQKLLNINEGWYWFGADVYIYPV